MSTIQMRYWLEQHRTRNCIPLSWNDQFFLPICRFRFCFVPFFSLKVRRYQSNLKCRRNQYFSFWFKKQKKVKKNRKMTNRTFGLVLCFRHYTLEQWTQNDWIPARSMIFGQFVIRSRSFHPSFDRFIISSESTSIGFVLHFLLPKRMKKKKSLNIMIMDLYNYGKQQSTKMGFDCKTSYSGRHDQEHYC